MPPKKVAKKPTKKVAKKKAVTKKIKPFRANKLDEGTVAAMVQGFAAGMTEVQVAEALGVHVRSIYNWKKKYPIILQAIKIAKDVVDDLVEAKLLHRALGYTHAEEKIFQHEGMVIRADTLKHYPPDVKAALSWLQNRRPDKWRPVAPERINPEGGSSGPGDDDDDPWDLKEIE